MTSIKIKQIALHHFARNGYEGASLAHIATDVGIKKQSIYTHFNGKDELFLAVVDDVFAKEATFIQAIVRTAKPTEQQLQQLIRHYYNRTKEDESVKFWLRVSFFPPAHLHDAIMVKVYALIDELERQFTQFFANEQAAIAFVALLDSLFIEMLYADEARVERRLAAALPIFLKGVL